MATDRELLQNLKSIIDAQLGLNVIPQFPTAQQLGIPAGTPAANANPMILSMVTAGHESSPGGPPPANVEPTPQRGAYWWGDWSMPSNGLDIYQYATPGTADGVTLGFTGTTNGRNYVNGNPWAPEYISQGTDPNKPSVAFESWLRHYGLGW